MSEAELLEGPEMELVSKARDMCTSIQFLSEQTKFAKSIGSL
jgi:hypothetical protein